MDPVSIATACTGTIGAITDLSLQITSFVRSVREARRDMEAVSRELTSLSICLTTLRDDARELKFPDTLLEVVTSCEKIANEMKAILQRLSISKTARLRWTASDRDQINKLRSSLESHKSCVDVALDMASL